MYHFGCKQHSACICIWVPCFPDKTGEDTLGKALPGAASSPLEALL